MPVEIRSEVAGTVFQVEVSAGTRVAAGDTLLILESMKMEIPVLSPKAGVIKEIKVSEGEAIGEGQLVVVLDA